METDKNTPPQTPENPKREYFERICHENLQAMRVLFRDGQLKKDPKDKEWQGYRTTVEHSVAAAAAMIELCDLLQVKEEERKNLTTAILVHDWQRRWEIEQKTDHTPVHLEELAIDPKLITATQPSFQERAKNATFAEKIMFYIDNILQGSEIVPLLQRIDEVASRRPELDNDPSLTRDGMPYWENERRIGVQIEQEIFEKLQVLHPDLPIESADAIPNFLRNKVCERIQKEGNI